MVTGTSRPCSRRASTRPRPVVDAILAGDAFLAANPIGLQPLVQAG
ncbi:hypothetical protein [Pseudonocardia aurantiaca]|uniref:Uncharacterized protein n=1 Tax=Pseudonocardia aurantiaca TaxID=75290 RepID=A0ABW4FNI5_9PSEU